MQILARGVVASQILQSPNLMALGSSRPTSSFIILVRIRCLIQIIPKSNASNPPETKLWNVASTSQVPAWQGELPEWLFWEARIHDPSWSISVAPDAINEMVLSGARSRNQAATARTLWETGALRTGGTAGSGAKGLVMDFRENNKPVEVYTVSVYVSLMLIWW